MYDYIVVHLLTKPIQYNFDIFSNTPFPPPVNPTDQTRTNTVTQPPAIDPNLLQLFNENRNMLQQQATMIQHLAPKAKTYSLNITPFVPMNYPAQVQDCYKLNMTQYTKYHTANTISDITNPYFIPN